MKKIKVKKSQLEKVKNDLKNFSSKENDDLSYMDQYLDIPLGRNDKTAKEDYSYLDDLT